MQAQIVLQDTKKWIENYGHRDRNYIHLIENFVWNHLFINIYKCMILNILYQLLKGVVGNIHILQ